MHTTSSTPRRRRTPKVEQLLWIKRFERSGLTPRAFCHQHKLTLANFQRWRYRHKSTPSCVPPLHPVSVSWPTPSESVGRWSAEIAISGATTLRLNADAPPDLVKILLDWLTRPC